MEYQAKELFAKHDVPVTLGIVVEDRRPGRRRRPSSSVSASS